MPKLTSTRFQQAPRSPPAPPIKSTKPAGVVAGAGRNQRTDGLVVTPRPAKIEVSAAADLASLYQRKCGALRLVPNPEFVSRLAVVDRTHDTRFDLEGVPLDESFEVLLEVLLLAASIERLNFNSTNMTDRHIDNLVHHFARSIALKEIKVENNHGITDAGGYYLCDLALHNRRIVEVGVDGTSISPKVRDSIAAAVDQNLQDEDEYESRSNDYEAAVGEEARTGAALDPAANGSLRPKNDGDRQRAGNMRHLESFARLHGTRSLAPCDLSQTAYLTRRPLGQPQRSSALALQESLPERNATKAMVWFAVLSLAESLLSILAWESVFRTTCTATIALSALWWVDSPFAALNLIGAMVLLQRRVWRGPEPRDLSGGDRRFFMLPADHSPTIRWLNWVRHVRHVLTYALPAGHPSAARPDVESVPGGTELTEADGVRLVQDLTRVTYERLFSMFSGDTLRKRLLLGTFVVSALSTFISFHDLLGIVLLMAFVWRPIGEQLAYHAPHIRENLVQLLGGTMSASGESWRVTERNLATLPSPLRRNDYSSQKYLTARNPHAGATPTPPPSPLSTVLSGSRHQEPEDPFQSPFPFVVFIEKLLGVDAQHLSGKGFVPFVQVKYNRKAWITRKARAPYCWNEQSNVFCFIPFAAKITFAIFDDATEMVGAVLEGHLILDDSVVLDEAIHVPLRAVDPEPSLLRRLVDEVRQHEERTRLIAAAPKPPTADFRVERPGVLVLRLRRVDGGDVLATATSSSPSSSFPLGFEPPAVHLPPPRISVDRPQSPPRSSPKPLPPYPPQSPREGQGRQSPPQPQSAASDREGEREKKDATLTRAEFSQAEWVLSREGSLATCGPAALSGHSFGRINDVDGVSTPSAQASQGQPRPGLVRPGPATPSAGTEPPLPDGETRRCSESSPGDTSAYSPTGESKPVSSSGSHEARRKRGGVERGAETSGAGQSVSTNGSVGYNQLTRNATQSNPSVESITREREGSVAESTDTTWSYHASGGGKIERRRPKEA